MMNRLAHWLVHEAGIVSKLVAFVVVAVVGGLLASGLVIPFAGAAGLGAKAGTDSFESMPSQLSTPPNKTRSTMVDSTGKTVATFFDENRVDVSLDKIAPVMRKAIVAIEDNRFYKHGAIDLRGTLRALVRNQQAGGVSQGGSSITQQYVKLTLLEQAGTDAERKAAIDDTYARKVQELRYAIAIEDQYSKDEILRRYLNIAYFGDGAYGIEAAAKHYFGTHAVDLTTPQAAMLAGMVRDPNGFDPVNDPKTVKTRRDFVLTRMYDNKAITAKQMKAAQKTSLGIKITSTPNGCISSPYPFYCQYVLETLLDNKALGATVDQRREYIYTGGLRITTSLDPQAQKAADKAVRKAVYAKEKAVGVISMIEPGTGLVKAMAQSRPDMGKKDGETFINYNVDEAHGGGIGAQPGSTMKVFVLAAAIADGIPLKTKIKSPQRYTSKGAVTTCKGSVRDVWNVRNSTGSGTFDLISATTHSVNTFFAQLEERTGICKPYTFATDAGVIRGDGAPLQEYKSFTLGVNEVTPLSMANGYATFAARGVHCDPVVVTKIVDSKGKSIATPDGDCKQVIPQNVADGVNYVLHQNMDGGTDPRRTAKSLILDDRQAGGKTGTNDSNKAVTFAGYTPNLAAVSMVADMDAPVKSLKGQMIGGKLDYSIHGSTTAGPIWKSSMEGALKGKEAPDFVDPEKETVEGKKADVPDVTGYSIESATTVLKAAGFTVAVGYTVDSAYPAGVIARQSQYGSIGVGTTIYIYPSDGTPYVAPPPPKPKPSKTPKPSPPATTPPPATPPATGRPKPKP
jgi:membrane peptidoglycan carboxypeptidase